MLVICCKYEPYFYPVGAPGDVIIVDNDKRQIDFVSAMVADTSEETLEDEIDDLLKQELVRIE